MQRAYAQRRLDYLAAHFHLRARSGFRRNFLEHHVIDRMGAYRHKRIGGELRDLLPAHAEVGEGFIIDTDHWRHFFLMLGLVWGLSTATMTAARAGSLAVAPR
jgi:hypothetical protein